MSTRQTTSMLVISMLALHIASAETRVWTDSDGTKLEAELVEYINGTVTLQAADEKQIQVGISSLSSEDQKVVLRSTPPDLDIHLKDSTDTENIGGGRNFDLDRTTYEFSLELEKEGSREYADTMTAEIYIIGYNRIQDKYIVLRKYEKPFSFANTSDDEIEIPLGRLSLTELGGNIEAGTEYEGSLVVLVDAYNHVFQMKGSRSKFEEHASVIRQKKQEDAVSGAELMPLSNYGVRGYNGRNRRGAPGHKGGRGR